MENRKNYQKILQNTIENLNNRPKLLLHVCCGPCSTIPLKIFKDHFDITLFFSNSNIYPKEEHDRRLGELKTYLIKSHNEDIPLVINDYDGESFHYILEPYKDLKEGYERCRVCFKTRFIQGFEYAYKNGFEYFGTVMTISRYKNAQDINKIGEKLQENYPTVKWLYADFKKNNGYEDSLIICKDFDLYFQEYCGCKFSYLSYLKKHQ
ncbi:MAG: epoxyqueuosine reductase QueH [Bacilli bacterium]|nr:epoxyqueuosine reductase QueH [Bacilli bacterium]